ncbi:aldehyde dehydrogenase family protein [Aeromicrobium panaciterrae]|uniref:aldehyde dehydrogenase family protein n=1 Tax=Aeromicrobium panaciterrae TaxID=363861 RepID=UPI0031D9A820
MTEDEMARSALIERGLTLGRGPTVLIGDRWEDGAGEGVLTSMNPSTGEVLEHVPPASREQASRAVLAARAALDGPWGRMSPVERGSALDRLADTLEAHSAELQALIVTELGSPIATTRTMQVATSIARIRFYAGLARSGPLGGWERSLPVGDGSSASILFWQPAGVVTAITAYNFPLGIAALKVGAALAAGCSVVLSPSPRTFLTSRALVRLAIESGLPPGVLNLVTGEIEASVELTTHPEVDVVSFTGSTAVGSQIQAQSAATVKRVVLELGGKSPSVILPDAPLRAAVTSSVLRFTRNAGQACGATTRLLVPIADYEEVAEIARDVMEALPVGDPWLESTVVGPLIRDEQRQSVEAVIDRALAAGACVLAGGGRPEGQSGFFLNPTLIGAVDNDAEISRRELFGPVAVVLPYEDVDEALALANATDFGLNAGVWGRTSDAMAFARRIRSGTVAINGGGPSRADMPWGGFGLSGIGRDGGEEGMREFLEVQHIHWPL